MKNLRIFITFIYCITLSKPALGNTKHMVCKTVEDVPTGQVEGNQITSSLHQLQGPPGTRGPVGIKGDPGTPGIKGQKGELGVVDYTGVNESVHEMIESAADNLTKRVEKLEELYDELKRNLSKSNDEGLACDGVTYKGTCYWAVVHSSRNSFNFNEASAICTDKQGKLAYIQDSEHFQQIKTYIRSLIPSSISWVHIWLGMFIDPSTKRVTLADRSVAPFTEWNTYPSSGSSFTHIQLQVYKQVSRPYQAMYNRYPSSKEHGALCQN